jgi:IclR family KDG regulon transcriptional repressor
VLNTLIKANDVLSLFSANRPEWGVSELASALNMSTSTMHDLLITMAHVGLLQHTTQRRYRLGWHLLTFSQTLLQTTEFRVEARVQMERLVNQLGETVHLAVLDDNMAFYVEKMQGRQPGQVSITSLGGRLHAHSAALGKVLLADQPGQNVRRLMEERGMPAFTAHTITTYEALVAELKRVRGQGYAVDREENIEDLCCIAAPIRDYTERVIAAMSLSVPAYRFPHHKEQYRQSLVQASQSVSQRLGYFGSHASRRPSVKNEG